jgi:hypothetical protein
MRFLFQTRTEFPRGTDRKIAGSQSPVFSVAKTEIRWYGICISIGTGNEGRF